MAQRWQAVVEIEPRRRSTFWGLRLHVRSYSRNGDLIAQMTMPVKPARSHPIVVEAGGTICSSLCLFHRFFPTTYLGRSDLSVPRGGLSKDLQVRAIVRHDLGLGWDVDLVAGGVPQPWDPSSRSRARGINERSKLRL
jgi:hypothetical protein